MLHLALNVPRVLESPGVTGNVYGRIRDAFLKVSTVENIVQHLVLNVPRVMEQGGVTGNANGTLRMAERQNAF